MRLEIVQEEKREMKGNGWMDGSHAHVLEETDDQSRYGKFAI